MIKAYAAFEPQGELKAFEYEPGDLESNDVELDVLYSGLCHSDIHVIDNDWGATEYPVVPGHEVVGKIAQIGSNVSDLAIGQIVGLGWHAGFCDSCSMCHSGNHNLCASAQPTVIGHHGGFADKVRAAVNSVVVIPAGIDLESAVPLFCAGITVFNPLVQFDIKSTDKVAVIGIGGLGHLALQFLNAWGCEVTAFTSSADKREEALALGAHQTLNSRDEAEITEAAGRFDFIISTVSVKLDWNLYLSTLAPKGRLHFVGAVLDPLDIAVFPLLLGQRSVSGSPVGSPETMVKMLEFAKLHHIKPKVEKFGFDKVNEAIARLRNGDAHYRIVLER